MTPDEKRGVGSCFWMFFWICCGLALCGGVFVGFVLAQSLER